MRPLILLALLTLTACGAGGAPVRPSASVAPDGAAGTLGVAQGGFSLGLAL